ncbi:hypothetical protein N9C39_02275 [Luminiphilus sp.]|nr:hypothetical protein [Luminiphilus sp.]
MSSNESQKALRAALSACVLVSEGVSPSLSWILLHRFLFCDLANMTAVVNAAIVICLSDG